MNFNKVIDYLNLIILTNKKQSISTTGALAGSASMHRPKGIQNNTKQAILLLPMGML
jgi:hypothetical protein